MESSHISYLMIRSGISSPPHNMDPNLLPSNNHYEDQSPAAPDHENGVAPSSSGRVRYIRSEVDRKGERHEKPGKRTNTTIDTSNEDSCIAFVVKEIWSHKTKEKTYIVLKGQDLRNIMYEVLGKQLEHEQNTNWLVQEQTIAEPMSNEIWYWNDLCNIAKSSHGTEQGRQDLQLLLDHICEIKLREVTLVKSILSVKRVLAKDLWCLFRPGTLIISRPFQDEPHLFRVNTCHVIDDAKQISVGAWAFSWTGTELIQEYYHFDIRESRDTNEELAITDLPCYPVEYFKNSDGIHDSKAVEALKRDLIARGKTFRDLCRESIYARQHTYEGELLTDGKDSYLLDRLGGKYDTIGIKKHTVKGDIMIDFKAYKLYSPSGIGATGSLLPQRGIAACKCRLCFDKSYNCTEWMRNFAADASTTGTTTNDSNESTEEDNNYLLLPARVLGYCFNTKVWAQFHVNGVHAIEEPDINTMMQKLIFPEEAQGVKEDLKNLIEQHGNAKPPLIVDPIKGKGAGLVILLHGPPGVGKTLTAETLAKCAGKPLYVVGASDIGLDPKVAEATLGRLFELAERWGAVLLIDEADVFLDSRGSKGEADLSKNALVSVMLRVLEYFKGILIMTTNRVMTFDVAMLSRCHYAVNFKPLTLSQEQKIWQDYVAQLTNENSKDKDLISNWVTMITKKRTKLSGREIRNVFTTAQTLAQADGGQVERKHLERVYDRLMEFSEAMEKNKTTQQALLNASY